MTDQERAKAAVALFPKIESALYSGDNLSNGEVASIVNAMGLLCPIAAGTHVIVPVKPTPKMMMLGHKTLETKLSYMVHEVTVDVIYSAMIAASQEGE